MLSSIIHFLKVSTEMEPDGSSLEKMLFLAAMHLTSSNDAIRKEAFPNDLNGQEDSG